MNNPEDYRALSGARKAAMLIALIGEEAAAPVLRNLSEEDLERIAEEVTSLGAVPAHLSTQVLEEYQQLLAAQEFLALGGRDMAIRLLVKALGENGARGMVERLLRPEDGKTARVDSLRKADAKQLAKYLAGEHPQTKTLILAHLDARQSSALLMNFDAQERANCVQRLANLGQFSPDAAAKVSTVLNRRLRSVGEQVKSAKNELRNIAEMLNRLDPISVRDILEKIEQSDPKLATGIRDLMFTFEDFLQVAERDMREIAKVIDKSVLLIALKGANEELRNHFYRTMSARAVELMKEDSEVMGPVRSKEVAKAQSEIIGIARQLEAEGTIALKTDEDDGYVF